MTQFSAPFSLQIPTYNVPQPAALPHYNTVYHMDINGNVTTATGFTGQITTVKAAQIVPGAASATVTSFVMPANAMVYDVFLNVLTAETSGATKTVTVGLNASESGGVAAGFLNGVSVANTGLVRGIATVTVGGSNTYYASTTRGSYLAILSAGANTAYENGLNYEHTFLTNSVVANELVYTPASTFSQCVADIYITYIQLTM